MRCSSSTTTRGTTNTASNARARQVDDAAVDERAGVEHELARPLRLLLELDVGDDEADVVLRAQDEHRAQVAEDQRDGHADRVHDPLRRLVVELADDDERHDPDEQLAGQEADQQAEHDGRDGGDRAAREADRVDGDHGRRERAGHEHAHEGELAGVELVGHVEAQAHRGGEEHRPEREHRDVEGAGRRGLGRLVHMGSNGSNSLRYSCWA
jgi:hypothetical protein